MAYTLGMGVHQTEHDWNSKMAGIPSISTPCTMNPYCIARMKNGEAVCKGCFADATMARYPALEKALEGNFKILTERDLTQEEANQIKIHWTPKLLAENPYKAVRFESFGEVATECQPRNYIRIMIANPDCHFTPWSKNDWLWAPAFEQLGKPDNCTFVYSSLKLNEIAEVPERLKPWVDHVFTVFTKEYAEAHGIVLNCAGIRCAGCLHCYKNDPKFFYINELYRENGGAKRRERKGE